MKIVIFIGIYRSLDKVKQLEMHKMKGRRLLLDVMNG